MYLQSKEWFQAIQCPINTSIWRGDFFFRVKNIRHIFIIFLFSKNRKFYPGCYPFRKSTQTTIVRVWSPHKQTPYHWQACETVVGNLLQPDFHSYPKTTLMEEVSVPCGQGTEKGPICSRLEDPLWSQFHEVPNSACSGRQLLLVAFQTNLSR